MSQNESLPADVLAVSLTVLRGLARWALATAVTALVFCGILWLLSLALPTPWAFGITVGLEVFAALVAVGVTIRRLDRQQAGARFADTDAEWLPFTTPSVVDESSVR